MNWGRKPYKEPYLFDVNGQMFKFPTFPTVYHCTSVIAYALGFNVIYYYIFLVIIFNPKL